MSDSTTPVPDSEAPRSAQLTRIEGVVHLEISYPVALDVASGSAIVTLPDQTRTEVVVITTHGDLIAAMIQAAEQARDDAAAGRTVPLVGKDSFRAEEVAEIAYVAAGAATAPLMHDHPDYVFPSERVAEGVNIVLAERGIRAHGDGTVDLIVPEQ